MKKVSIKLILSRGKIPDATNLKPKFEFKFKLKFWFKFKLNSDLKFLFKFWFKFKFKISFLGYMGLEINLS